MVGTLNNNYYKLYIYLDSSILNFDIIEKYKNKVKNIQQQFEKDIEKGLTSFENYDAGFDLFLGQTLNISKKQLNLIHNHGIKCLMKFKEINTGFYLYPRSSISKTSIRLSNSVGIIDSGYRGVITAVVDCLNICNDGITFNSMERYFQICHRSLSPFKVVLADTLDSLGTTERGDGGFGSSGR